MINGEKESLNTNIKKFNIVILSNIPFEYYELRKAALNLHSLNFPFMQIKEKKELPVLLYANLIKKRLGLLMIAPYKFHQLEEK